MTADPLTDAAMRAAAVEQLRRRAVAGVLTSDDLAAGFAYAGERVPLINPQRGIFRPRVMRHLLSVRTVFPSTGSKIWYDDQRQVHRQILAGDEVVDYAFMVGGPDMPENRHLREAMREAVPILYFLGVAPGRYTLVYPTYVADWSADTLTARLAFGAPAGELGLREAEAPRNMPTAAERRYGLRLVRQRLHQATFREAVLAAYGGRCAISGLPEPRLLDAAHIAPDRDETLGQPIVPNGLPLSKVHHAAFDAHLIGIDPDFRIHVSPQLLAIDDGPMLEQGIKAMAGRTIRLPNRRADQPDRDRLSARFADFQSRN
ncbi:HNH endonuclease [Methylobacterium terricola]|uniref:HNH endonuclease n=1 Tax=Methylobacterium terricola TaxID=2583531 RepID=A0A5C4LF81_9HYPH|nr:HNH endonuclease [Methylobacterium terricola]TNC12489.1 HNH endonuclease [Methylobacterium terricola]